MAKEIVGERPSLKVKRFYPVTPAKVWRAWTDARALGQWFRPSGTCTQLDLLHEGYLDFVDQPTHDEGWNGALDKLGAILKGEVKS